MPLRDLFVADITRDIPPVVYFHEDGPQKLADEVGEYIITGGYPDGDPRAKRVKDGIHECLVRLLTAMHQEQSRKGGPELPASWISGFYGSGKSSFAKLLGFALDGKQLPDGTPLSEAFVARDDSPKRDELREAYERFASDLQAMAVVFDIGGVARDDEHIHSAVVRRVQKRLDYCTTSDLVAAFELTLERDGQWDEFMDLAETTLGKPWGEAKGDYQADDHFSEVMHKLNPERYPDPMSWIDARAGTSRTGLSVNEAVAAIQDMVKHRAPGRTLFIVIDEVSQYVHESEDRMLKLQSFVSELGQRLKGGAWLLATGQQKLEDSAETVVLGKMKDRFPASLRVHLGSTNIRDVIHRRLLKKKPSEEGTLRDLFETHRSELKLYGYRCEDLTDLDFLEVYPMLPGQIDLLMRITTNLRSRSTRVQGDSHAIRGLLQLLGELFRSQDLADAEVGTLVTIDAIYEVIHTALDADTQSTLARIFDFCARTSDDEADRVAKAVALLELVQDDEPTTSKLVARCLYAKLGQGSRDDAIGEALERLRAEGLLGYSEKHGYKIQSSAGQEWERERNDLPAPHDRRSALIRQVLAQLLHEATPPSIGKRKFPFVAFYSDGRSAHDERLITSRDDAVTTVDLRYLKADDRNPEQWVPKSAQEPLSERLLWIVGDEGQSYDLAGRLAKSKAMVGTYAPRRESLSGQRKQLLHQEEAQADELESQLRKSLDDAFHRGTFFFRGGQHAARDEGGSFALALTHFAGRLVPKLYPHFVETAVLPKELEQLLALDLAGPSTKFLEGGLGLLSLDAGRYVPSCDGQVPQRILAFIKEQQGALGTDLYRHFGGPPFGYAPDLVRACIVGLVRGAFVQVHPVEGSVVTSVRDPGARDLFTKDAGFRKATIVPASSEGVGRRDLVKICKLLDAQFGTKLERDHEHVADAVFSHLPRQAQRIREVAAMLNRLPGRPDLPPPLKKLQTALDQCGRDRHVQPTLQAVFRNLDALRDGFEHLSRYHTELLHDDALPRRLQAAADAREHMAPQLAEVGKDADVKDHVDKLAELLDGERPWRAVAEAEPLAAQVREHYHAARQSLLADQERAVEAAKDAIKRRDGFEKLDPDQRNRVLRPFRDAISRSDADALQPSLAHLRDGFASRLEHATDVANDQLDRELEKLDAGPPIVALRTELKGREITDETQLEKVLDELRERIGKLLKEGKRVRLS